MNHEPLKNLLNQEFVHSVARAVSDVSPQFQAVAYISNVLDAQWESREFMDRIGHLAVSLRPALPGGYLEALPIVVNASPAVDGIGHLLFPHFVQVFGLDHFEPSTQALAAMTSGSSSEFAVRPYILRYPQEMMARMLTWAKDPNEHLRRLASEGCRPRLPWGKALPAFKIDPAPILPILQELKADPSEYVRRSVANNLNDISKDHPDLVLDITRDWLGLSPDTDKLLKHACRTLLKSGNQEAMRLFGLQAPKGVSIEYLTIDPHPVTIGDKAQVSFLLKVKDAAQQLRVEYAVHYRKRSGGLFRKMFQIADKTYGPGEHPVARTRPFHDMTTRKHHPGGHRLEVVVNGHVLAALEFELLAAK